ncbi:hypothetical protein HNP86_002000 [Methanococcus maripaludis]|uniref:Uncharacterized protein n=1 Tax=Methanococcus maripaludis TaxID=39152 RepID=A0A7J9NX17_METMI|nr:hypothetical protein [Methanococcus maripaludis]MBA2851841.1 hypothetical protein [Methanococcus maripaludis]
MILPKNVSTFDKIVNIRSTFTCFDHHITSVLTNDEIYHIVTHMPLKINPDINDNIPYEVLHQYLLHMFDVKHGMGIFSDMDDAYNHASHLPPHANCQFNDVMSFRTDESSKVFHVAGLPYVLDRVSLAKKLVNMETGLVMYSHRDTYIADRNIACPLFRDYIIDKGVIKRIDDDMITKPLRYIDFEELYMYMSCPVWMEYPLYPTFLQGIK